MNIPEDIEGEDRMALGREEDHKRTAAAVVAAAAEDGGLGLPWPKR